MFKSRVVQKLIYAFLIAVFSASAWFAYTSNFANESLLQPDLASQQTTASPIVDFSAFDAREVGYWRFAGSEWEAQSFDGVQADVNAFDVAALVAGSPSSSDQEFIQCLEALEATRMELAHGLRRYDLTLPPLWVSVLVIAADDHPSVQCISAGMPRGDGDRWDVWRLRRSGHARQVQRMLPQLPEDWRPALVRSDADGAPIAELYVGCRLSNGHLQDVRAIAVTNAAIAGLEQLFLVDQADGQLAIRVISAYKGVFMVARTSQE